MGTPLTTSLPAGSEHLGIPEEALKGVTIQVWHPWFVIEADLFESKVKEFNQTNEWGITVQSTSQINYPDVRKRDRIPTHGRAPSTCDRLP
jgi:hypothetical protein